MDAGAARMVGMLLRPLAGAMFVALATAALPARAAEFKSVGIEPAVLYDAPTQRGRKLFVAPRGMPLEVIVGQGDWARVRDAGGDLTWVEKRALLDKRMVVATALATVRGAADANAAPLFQVQKGVLLEMAEAAANGWVKVRHADGATGYVKASEVWGE